MIDAEKVVESRPQGTVAMLRYEDENSQLKDKTPCAGVRADLKMLRSPAARSVTMTPSPAKSTRSTEVSAPSHIQCLYDTCSLPRMATFDYCSRHILQDHTAPFKQCAYVYNSTGKRCLGTAPKGEKRDGRKAQAMKSRATRPRAQPETADTLLQSLKDINAARLNGGVARVLDLASDSDSEPCEGGNVTLDAAWSGDSETEGDSPDSDTEDPLRHAGVYTDEEVVAQARGRLKRLQCLYMREFRSLQFRLREQRRFYLMALKREKETLMSIHQQPKKTAEDLAAYRKLQALNHYRKLYGTEAVLHKKAKDRKAQALLVSNSNRQGHASRCSFTEGGVKCDDKALPMAKLCQRHILNDTQQLLFRACGVSKAELPPCKEPVLAVFSDTTCLCHRDFPNGPLPESTLIKLEEVVPLDIKQETIDVEDSEMEMDPQNSTPVCTTEDSSACLELPTTSNVPEIVERETPVQQSDRRRKQDLSEVVAELPQESDNESITTVSANESYSSDVIML
ncbi:hypothetical protein B566_EDAN012721 [Ephemera danica]|nr:hypothetical protein B566_EDAN012721 [Ephemera danica]